MPHRKVLIGACVHSETGAVRDLAVVVEGARIAEIAPLGAVDRSGAEVLDLGGLHLAAGFIDLQVNGGGGVMFNDEPTPEAIARIVHAHRRFGTTALLPTFITGPFEGMQRASAAVHEARRRGGAECGVLGVHFEGPFLDVEKPGAHDRGYLRAPTQADLELFANARLNGSVVLLTLAAEHFDQRVAAALTEAGVRVSLGHCAATSTESRAAFQRGATLVTHLFNAMSPLTSRDGGLVGAALDAAAAGGVHVGLILDGVHVAFDVARVALRAAGPDGIFLVTDAVAPVGAVPALERFELGGVEVRVREGRCVNADGVLAGSTLDMASAVRNAVEHVGLELRQALRMASALPAAAIGCADRKGHLAVGYDADLVWFDDRVHVQGTLVGGASTANEARVERSSR